MREKKKRDNFKRLSSSWSQRSNSIRWMLSCICCCIILDLSSLSDESAVSATLKSFDPMVFECCARANDCNEHWITLIIYNNLFFFRFISYWMYGSMFNKFPSVHLAYVFIDEIYGTLLIALSQPLFVTLFFVASCCPFYSVPHSMYVHDKSNSCVVVGFGCTFQTYCKTIHLLTLRCALCVYFK